MPPKAKFSREECIQAALDIVREKGIDALTSRALGEKLGSSARPIFTVFENMEDVQQSVIDATKSLCRTYIQQGLLHERSFKGVGAQYILFSIKEPKLFQLLFMREQKEIPNLSSVLPIIEESYEQILLSIQKDYGIDFSSAETLYKHLWIYTHGIATLCATKMCRFTSEEINHMISEVCISILKNMKKH